jgi:hypothetical protein
LVLTDLRMPPAELERLGLQASAGFLTEAFPDRARLEEGLRSHGLVPVEVRSSPLPLRLMEGADALRLLERGLLLYRFARETMPVAEHRELTLAAHRALKERSPELALDATLVVARRAP